MSVKDCELDLDENQHQSTSQDAMLFPCTAYFTDIKRQFAGELPWHWHEEVEILIVKKGTVKFSFPQESIVLTEGQGCFINSHVLHAAYVERDDECILHSLLFLPSLISGSVECVFNQRYVKPLIHASQLPFIILEPQVSWQREVLNSLEETYYVYEASQFGFEWAVRDGLSKIWYLIIQNNQELLEETVIKQDSTLDRVKTMLDFIHSNFQYSISIAEIAKSANISDRECLRSFQKNIEISPMQYLIQYRISVASKYLLETELDITTICHEVGMESPSYFSKKFKEIRGLTPGEYRKQRLS